MMGSISNGGTRSDWLDSVDDDHWYRIEVDCVSTLTISLDYDYDVDFDWELYTEGGSFVMGSYSVSPPDEKSKVVSADCYCLNVYQYSGEGWYGVTVTWDCGCTDYRPCEPVTKGGYQYTIGQPIGAGMEPKIIGDNPRQAHMGGTIRITARETTDRDCKIVGAGEPKEEVFDGIWMVWSDNTGRSPSQAFPSGNGGWSKHMVYWRVPDTPGSYTVTCTWSNLSSDCYYEDDPVSRNVTIQAMDFCSVTQNPGWATTFEVTSWEEDQTPPAPITDDCGNTIEIKYNSSNGCWEILYNGKVVGRCIWNGGHNKIEYECTWSLRYGIRRIALVRSSSKDSQRYLDDPEGCWGYYCYMCHEYDAIGACFNYRNWRGRGSIFNPPNDLGELWPGEAPICPGGSGHHEDLEIPE